MAGGDYQKYRRENSDVSTTARTDSSTGTPALTPLISMTGSGYSVDYGSRGVQLTTGASLQATLSATGAAGVITVEAYWKYGGGTSVGVFPASGASGSVP